MAKFDAILALVQKQYKFIEAKLLSSANAFEGTKYRRSGCYALDYMLANHNASGGLPRGRIIEFYGPEGCGKTTLATVCAASINRYKERNKVLYLDFEHKWDFRYALSLGINKENVYFSQPSGPESGVAGLTLMIEAIDAEDIGLIIVDSLPAVMSKEEEEGDLTDANIGASARLWGKALKKVANASDANTPSVIVINQLRDNIGVMFGPKEKTAGGRALRFYATCRVDIRATEKNKDNEEDDEAVTSQNNKLKIVKNQAGENFQSTEVQLIFGEGYNNELWVLDKAVELDIIKCLKKSSPRRFSWEEKFPGEKIEEEAFLDILDTTSVLNELYTLCINKKQKITAETEAAALEARRLKEEAKNSLPKVDLTAPDFS